MFAHVFNRSSVSEVVTFIMDSKPTSVLCHMGDFGCGDGGWTQVMKIDGNKVLYLLRLNLNLNRLNRRLPMLSSH